MKKRFLRILFLSLACVFTGTACVNSPDQNKLPNGVLGGWIAGTQDKVIPDEASVFIGFWESGAYTLVTRHNRKESRIQGLYRYTDGKIIFDGKTAYGCKLDRAANTLELTAPDGTRIRYERVKMELLPADSR